MIIFISQFDYARSAKGDKQWKLMLDIDDSHRQGLIPLIQNAQMGDTYLTLMIPIDDNFISMGEAVNETEESIILRLRKQAHALIRDVAKEKGLTVDEVRTSLKDMLSKKGYLKESLKELDIKGYAAAIYILRNEF